MLGIRLRHLGATSEQSDYSRRIEALADEVPVHALHGERVVQRQAAAQTAIQGMLEQLGFVDFREDLRDSFAGDVAGNPERFDAPDDPRAAVMTEAYLGSRTSDRGASIVHGTLEPQSRDGGVDVFLIELAPGEALP